MIVVDTSVLVDLFRGRKTAAADRLRHLERTGTPYAVPAICAQEVLQGARDQAQWRMLLSYLGTQHSLTPRDPWLTYTEAARIYFDCRRRGLTLRGTVDCLIAQMVLEADGDLLHDDNDFELVRRVRPLRTMRS